jgi:hypothetical protein
MDMAHRNPANLFNLPLEVRLLIWESTWPLARIVALTQNLNETDHYRTQFLLPRYERFATQEDNDSRFSAFKPIPSRLRPNRLDIAYSVPLALHICHESRSHTLKTFVLISAPSDEHRSFYFNPAVDAVLLDKLGLGTRKLRAYGKQLAHFRTAIANAGEWKDVPSSTDGFAPSFNEDKREEVRKMFSGLEVVLFRGESVVTELSVVAANMYACRLY